MQTSNSIPGDLRSSGRGWMAASVRALVLAGLVAMVTLGFPEDRAGAGHGDLGWKWFSSNSADQLAYDGSSSSGPNQPYSNGVIADDISHMAGNQP